MFAKDGLMSQVRSFRLRDRPDREPLAFSIIVNGFSVPSREINEVMDKALVALAAFSR